ncbi:zinc finger CCCH domain-containing protein 34-like [Silene latifolia]|uniref:zinc finger CCCH domain-containing protein 34-like n=1 Tax=Silene latifolia TaxID=37657 RepID=UPI003D772634
MDDQFMKRSTDCLSYLASPFTCNKGAECEYRHSDTARMNPRDCRYWLSGTCFNPTCPFRHPPLDVDNELSCEAAGSLPNQLSVPATKTTVPCYYYYNGFCNKGDKCLFLHEWCDTFTWNPKVSNSATDAPVAHLGSKASCKSDSKPTQPEKHHSISEMAMSGGHGSQSQQSQGVQKASTKTVGDRNASFQTYVPECGETDILDAVSLQPSEDSLKSKCEPSLCSDQCSEDLIDGNVVPDEWWESSPGFDVLVDGQTQDLANENDMQSLDESDGDRDPLSMRHGFEIGYGYDEREFLNDGLYGPSEHLDSMFRANCGSLSPRCTRNEEVRHFESLKRKFGFEESLDVADLRDHLWRKRMPDYYLDKHDLRHELLRRRYGKADRFTRHRPNQGLHGRLASRVERNGAWLESRETSVNATNLRARIRNSQQNNYRKYNGMRGRKFLAKALPRPELKREKYAQEEKEAYYSEKDSVDFEGPKPLNEILKEKKKTMADGIMTGCF